MCDRVDGCPESMRDFLQLRTERPDLSTVPTVKPGAACGTAGMMSCADLSAVDRDITARLLHFLTHMTQGINGYLEIITNAAQTYADGASSAAATIKAACTYDPHRMLPDVAPELVTPRSAPQGA
jgi:hypothetical protein